MDYWEYIYTGLKIKTAKRIGKEKNPFEYVGVYIDEKGRAKYCELKDGEWVIFGDYPDCQVPFSEQYWTGKVYLFSHRVYDWIEHDGYSNLGRWIEEAAKSVRG